MSGVLLTGCQLVPADPTTATKVKPQPQKSKSDTPKLKTSDSKIKSASEADEQECQQKTMLATVQRGSFASDVYYKCLEEKTNQK